MRSKLSLFAIFFSVILWTSCSSYKSKLESGNSIDAAIKNAIIDYSRFKGVSKKHTVFEVDLKVHKKVFGEDYYSFLIDPLTNAYPITQYDTIGGKSNLLYNDFLVKKGKLFLWVNPTKTTNLKTLEIMNQFKILDSSFITKSKKSYVFSTKSFPNDIKTYIFCKSDVSNYLVIKGESISMESFYLKCN